jgi:hypothetical protein
MAGQCCVESCGGIDPADVCVTPPNACDDVWDPVCGCDGQTYGNACEAHAACIAIAYHGDCGPMCAYAEPGPTGCPMGTTECPVGGPAMKCVAPDRYAACCCETCV